MAPAEQKSFLSWIILDPLDFFWQCSSASAGDTCIRGGQFLESFQVGYDQYSDRDRADPDDVSAFGQSAVREDGAGVSKR